MKSGNSSKSIRSSIVVIALAVLAISLGMRASALTLADYGLKEGDLIGAKSSGDPDIYIVNEHLYKRLFLNPVIFSFYGHLGGYANVKNVSPGTRDDFATSGLYRYINDQKVYCVEVTSEDTGIFHWVNTSGAQAVADDPNFFKKVFIINQQELAWYPQGASYSSPRQCPDYSRYTPNPTPTPYVTPSPTVSVSPTPTPTVTPTPTATPTATPKPYVAPGTYQKATMFEGLIRTYDVYIPTNYNSIAGSLPMVMVMHGGGGNAEIIKNTTEFDAKANAEGFVVVYPNGTGLLPNVYAWNDEAGCCGQAAANDINDIGFLKTVADQVQSQYVINSQRIYATGVSNGAMMAHQLAQKHSNTFAAIAAVSSTLAQFDTPKSAISVLVMHGTNDQNIPYNGGVGNEALNPRDNPSVATVVNHWKNWNACVSSSTQTMYGNVDVTTYSGCREGVTVQLYKVNGGEHEWYGSPNPKTIQQFKATDVVWDFFKNKTL